MNRGFNDPHPNSILGRLAVKGARDPEYRRLMAWMDEVTSDNVAMEKWYREYRRGF